MGTRWRGAGRGLSGRDGPCRMQRMQCFRARIPATDDGAGHYPASAAPTPTRRPRWRRPLALLAVLALLAGCGRGGVRPTPRAAATVLAGRDWPGVAPQGPAAAQAVLVRGRSLVGPPCR